MRPSLLSRLLSLRTTQHIVADDEDDDDDKRAGATFPGATFPHPVVVLDTTAPAYEFDDPFASPPNPNRGLFNFTTTLNTPLPLTRHPTNGPANNNDTTTVTNDEETTNGPANNTTNSTNEEREEETNKTNEKKRKPMKKK
jgi:hypothetical protein